MTAVFVHSLPVATALCSGLAASMPTIKTPHWLLGFPSCRELNQNHLKPAIPVLSGVSSAYPVVRHHSSPFPECLEALGHSVTILDMSRVRGKVIVATHLHFHSAFPGGANRAPAGVTTVSFCSPAALRPPCFQMIPQLAGPRIKRTNIPGTSFTRLCPLICYV